MNTQTTRLLAAALCGLLPLLSGFSWPWSHTPKPPAPAPVEIAELQLTGKIAGENATFTLAFTAQVNQPGAEIAVARGATSWLGGDLPASVRLLRDGDGYRFRFTRAGRQNVTFTFASRARQDADWRQVRFAVPEATVRRVAVTCDRPDLDVRIAGAAHVRRDGGAALTALLPPGAEFAMSWKPEVRRLDGELMVACDANTVAIARVGALQLNTILQYRIAQGTLEQLELAVPANLQVTQVRGADIREWGLRAPAAGQAAADRLLTVTLNRPQDTTYTLMVEGEVTLPAFPAKAALPFLTPRKVIRTSGFLLLGADSAIKLLVTKATGLTQVDQAAFPQVAPPDAGSSAATRAMPGRGAYAYQYANLPCQMELSAEDIVTGLFADHRLVLGLDNNTLTLAATTEFDIRDAPAREIVLETDPAWTVANVTGAQLADYDVRDQDGRRLLRLAFRDAATGRALVEVRLERQLPDRAAEFATPLYRVQNAKAERGCLVCRAEPGVRLKPEQSENVREVSPNSLPLRVANAQNAFRFKDAQWRVTFRIDQAAPALNAELFQLASLGEGAVYGSCSITYGIGGTPVRGFRVRVPPGCQNVEFTGRDVRSWQKDGETYTVQLQDRVAGDYTLLVTYDQPIPASGEILLGGIRTLDTASETGYLALAGPASTDFAREAAKPAATVLPLSNGELPPEYLLLVNDPVLKCYKYFTAKGDAHEVRAVIKRYPTLPLPQQVADHQTLATRISEAGEAVTTATYYVKNSSRQYFHVALPAGAKLWSVTVDGRTVQALDDGKSMVLVPLARRRDPNLAAVAVITYAEQQGAIGWRRRLAFTAPTTDAKAVFARWTFQAPAQCTIAPAGGNLLPEQAAAPNRLQALAAATGRVLENLMQRKPLLALLPFLLLPLAALIVFNDRRGRARHWSSWLAGGLAVLVLLTSLAAGRPLLRYYGEPAGLEPLHTLSLTKPVILADSLLKAGVTIRADAFVLAVNLGLLLAALAAAGLLLQRARGRSRFAAGLALALLVWGLAGFRPCLLPLAWLLLVVPVAALWLAGLRTAARAGLRRRPPPPSALPPELTPPAAPPPAAPGVGLGVLGLLLAAGLWLGAAAPAAAAPQPAPEPPVPAPVPVMDGVTLAVTAPDVTSRDPKAARDAAVSMTVSFTGTAGQRFRLLAKPNVLDSYDLDQARLRLLADDTGYWLEPLRDGPAQATVRFLAPVRETGGAWSLALPVPANRTNTVTVRLPGAGWDVRAPEAVLLNLAVQGGATRCDLVAGPEPVLNLVWAPQARNTRLEKADFFAETNTLALFQPGLVVLTSQVRFQIAQGELQALTLNVPKAMNVTAVAGNDVGTWRFDPETRRLEVLLNRPVSGDYLLTVVTQMPQESLPYQAALAPLAVQGASRQRGTLALAATDAVQIRADDLRGATGMNTGDFQLAPAASGAARPAQLQAAAPEIKRAYRFQQADAGLTVTAEKVLPELRVDESAQVDVSDERVKLSTTLALTIAKAGLFSVRLDLPPQFDVESLTGDDLSHWDEIKDADGSRGLIVHFTRQALGDRRLNLVLSRQEKGIAAELLLPRVTVRDAYKQTGTVILSGERGVRFTVARRDGVSDLNPRELGLDQPGLLAFKLLRPDWRVVLKTETLAPVVRSELLQRLELSEGLVKARAVVLYTIEHAGVKLFRLQAPAPGAALAVTGRNIAQVRNTDPAKGIWEVELTGKAEKEYRLEAAWQAPVREPVLAPLRTLDVDAQKSWLVLFAGERLQVKPGALPEGMTLEDPRGIPGRFNAGDLAGAVLCAKTVRPDAALPLEVQRHDTAGVLSAKVRQMRLATVVSNDFQTLTRAELTLDVNHRRALKLTLPAGQELWSAFVNGKAVVPLLETGAYLVPLDPGAATATVELLTGGAATAAGRRLTFDGPRFDLPLTDVEWTFYLPPNLRYYGADGTLRPRPDTGGAVARFSTDQYSRDNQARVTLNARKAEEVMQQGTEYFQAGKQLEARQALQSAIAYSQGQQDLNEDARIQFRNVVRQQAVVGLANRRNVLKIERNNADENAQKQNLAFNGGQFNASFSRQVEQSLGAEEQSSLNKVAEKILDQQAAAEADLNPIRITVPEQGRCRTFFRELQVQDGAPMQVRLQTLDARWNNRAGTAAAALALLALTCLTATLATGRKQNKA
jgi:hypothetical protein